MRKLKSCDTTCGPILPLLGEQSVATEQGAHTVQHSLQTNFKTHMLAMASAVFEPNHFKYVPIDETIKNRDSHSIPTVVEVIGADGIRKPSCGERFGLLSSHLTLPFARFALFVVYFWFGVLKLLGVSPAGPLVTALWHETIPFIPLDNFMMLFALYEMLIGIMFLIPRLERVAIASILLHVFTTCMPLVLLPHIVWQMFMVPSLEGQYIIKNIVVLALALSIGASLRAGLKDGQSSRRLLSIGD